MTQAALSEAERRDWLRLARTDSVGAVTFARLLDRYGSPTAALAALPELARRGGRAVPPRIPPIEEIDRELSEGDKFGARLLLGCDPGFPFLLSVLDPPPPALWVLGDPAQLRRDLVAVVGARIASAGGRQFARDLAAALGLAGWGVVSGLARGIDTAAHQGSLPHGAVAVLAGGVDTVYPPENADLHAALAKRGCIVSERPIGATARAADFPRRNRIISGLARGVVVIEAELRSGSLITARLAAEQGREVFAVPGSPLDPRARGPNDLIRQGATLVESADDVLRVLSTLPGVEAPAKAWPAPRTSEPPGSRPDPDQDLNGVIQGLLSPVPMPVNAIAREAGAPVSAVLAALTELALAGRVDFLPGDLVVKA